MRSEPKGSRSLKQIRVAVVEDDEDIRKAVAFLLDDTKGFTCAGEFADAESALAMLPTVRADVVLMDIALPGLNGVEAVSRLRTLGYEGEIIMVTVHKDDDLVFRSLCAGASGYLLKDTRPSRLLEAIRDVVEGGAPMSSHIARKIVRSFHRSTTSPLTERETDVLSKLCEGHSYKMIADVLCISEETVHHHIKNIYRKLHVHSKSEAVLKAVQEKLL
jgi:DNA-binding NarL/FixJ family response regulator